VWRVMTLELDLTRLARIREVLGVELSELIGGMLDTMHVAIDQAELAMSTGDLEGAAKAAHACRNDALMLGAKELLAALESLEQAARSGNRAGADQALVSLRTIWPLTRDELMKIASDT
jgi:HPt (histidine-containing phosphotransfer) domain-containing protein